MPRIARYLLRSSLFRAILGGKRKPVRRGEQPTARSDAPAVLKSSEPTLRGIDLLRERFEVDVVTDMTDEQLLDGISAYDGIVIRSATQMTAAVIAKASRLKVIGRAGIGTDNIDLGAATKRGII
ncbi:MAG: hypothetical protein ABGY75_16120, partial [Gemmataceae bacterium]